MALRTGSIGRELAQEDPQLLELILADYRDQRRRERASRLDFASGWLAAMRRLGKLGLGLEESPSVPW